MQCFCDLPRWTIRLGAAGADRDQCERIGGSQLPGLQIGNLAGMTTLTWATAPKGVMTRNGVLTLAGSTACHDFLLNGRSRMLSRTTMSNSIA